MSPSDLTKRLATSLQTAGDAPVAHRITEHVWTEVINGSLATGARLPTVRRLAIDLGVSPRTVERAYEALERMGVTSTQPGEGTFVSLSPPSDESRRRREAFLALCDETLTRARELGYSLDDLLDELAEFRTLARD